MSDNWLVIDCDYLCHRAHWSMRDELSAEDGSATSVVFGFLSTVLWMQDRFDASHVVFCWDVGESLRKKILPQYKGNRRRDSKNASPEERHEARRQRKALRRQTHKLRIDILNDLGYENVLYKPGYEADDWIAATCRSIQYSWPMDDVFIISADYDLLQCLAHGVNLYSPATKKVWTLREFVKTYKLGPSQWLEVKAIAGCSTDNIPGVPGVGEKTAIKYVNGELKGNKVDDIEEAEALIERNKELVELPFRDELKRPKLTKTLPDKKSWKRMMKKIGMPSLVKQGPHV